MNFKASKLPVKTWALVGVAAVIVAAITGVTFITRDSKPPPQDIEPEWVRVVILSHKRVATSRLESGALFFLTYNAVDPADNERLRLGPAIGLRLDGKHINTLVTKLGGKDADVRPPSAATESVLLRGPGPYVFRLPKLLSGSYQLCGGIGLDKGEEREEMELFCKTIMVVDP